MCAHGDVSVVGVNRRPNWPCQKQSLHKREGSGSVSGGDPGSTVVRVGRPTQRFQLGSGARFTRRSAREPISRKGGLVWWWIRGGGQVQRRVFLVLSVVVAEVISSSIFHVVPDLARLGQLIFLSTARFFFFFFQKKT